MAASAHPRAGPAELPTSASRRALHLDFYCSEARLAVEVDGEGHGYRADYDARRDSSLAERAIEVMRIGAKAVMEDPDMVAQLVWETVAARVARTWVTE